MVLGFFRAGRPQWLIGAVAASSFLDHFSAIIRGVIDLRDVVFFVSIMVAFLVRQRRSSSISKKAE